MSRIEPPADRRNLAAMHFQMYLARVEAGFTEDRALRLLCTMLRATYM